MYIILGNTYEIKEQIKAQGGHYIKGIGWYFDTNKAGYKLYEVADEEAIYVVDGRKYANPNFKLPVRGEYLGEIGKRITFTAKVTNAFYDTLTFYGHRRDQITYYLNDNNGNLIVWTSYTDILEGENNEITLVGTVKDHREYNGTKRTYVKNCRRVA